MLQYKLDNEFELVFVAGYQKVLQLSYVDKFLDDIHREIRDRYKNRLADKRLQMQGLDIEELYQQVLREAEIWSFEMAKQPKQMRTFEESRKSKKTVASMIDRPNEEKKVSKSTKQQAKPKNPKVEIEETREEEILEAENEENQENVGPEANSAGGDGNGVSFIEPKILPKGVMRKPGPGKYQ